MMGGSITTQCVGCDKVTGVTNCSIWGSPATKWRLGTCPSATHVKREFKSTDVKVRVGQQKQKKAR